LRRRGAQIPRGHSAGDLLAFVRSSGGLVLAGNSGDYNERREKRRQNAFLPARLASLPVSNSPEPRLDAALMAQCEPGVL
jgi:hypothetical protein